MLLFHVDLKGFLVFIVPVALGTLECFAGVSRRVPTVGADPAGDVEDEVTVGALNARLAAVDVLRAGSYRRPLKHVSIGCKTWASC